MNFTLISPENQKEAVLSLPCCEEGISTFCANLQIKNTAKTEVIVKKMDKHPDLFLLLGRKTCYLQEMKSLNWMVKLVWHEVGRKRTLFHGNWGKFF